MQTFLRAAVATAALLSSAHPAAAVIVSFEVKMSHRPTFEEMARAAEAKEECAKRQHQPTLAAFFRSRPSIMQLADFGGCVNGKYRAFGMQVTPHLISKAGMYNIVLLPF